MRLWYRILTVRELIGIIDYMADPKTVIAAGFINIRGAHRGLIRDDDFKMLGIIMRPVHTRIAVKSRPVELRKQIPERRLSEKGDFRRTSISQTGTLNVAAKPPVSPFVGYQALLN